MMNLITIEYICKSCGFVAGLIFLSTTFVQLKELYKVKSTKGISFLSYYLLILGNILNMVYFTYIKIVMLQCFVGITIFAMLWYVIMLHYYRSCHDNQQQRIELYEESTSSHSIINFEYRKDLTTESTSEHTIIMIKD